MNTTSTLVLDYYDNGTVSNEDVRAMAHRLCLESGDASSGDPQSWLEAEAWFRFRNSEGGEGDLS